MSARCDLLDSAEPEIIARMKFEETFAVVWDEHTIERATHYLKERGFTLQRHNHTLSGSRGSMVGNMTSFDMTRVMATCRIEPIGNGIRCTINVDTTGQDITEWNIAVWRMELIELHQRLSGGEDLGNVWRRLKSASSWASFVWAITLGLGGRQLTQQWAEELDAFEDRFHAEPHQARPQPAEASQADVRWASLRQLLTDIRYMAGTDARWQSAADQLEQAARERLAALARLKRTQRAHEDLGGPSAELTEAQRANEVALQQVIEAIRQVHSRLTVAAVGTTHADELLAQISADLEVEQTGRRAQQHATARLKQ